MQHCLTCDARLVTAKSKEIGICAMCRGECNGSDIPPPHPAFDHEDALLASCWNVYGPNFRPPSLPL